MIGEVETLKILFEKYKISEPVSLEQQEYIIKQRKSDLKDVLKKTGGYGFIFWLTVLLYDGLRKFGIQATLVQSKILLCITAAVIASGSSTGAYFGAKYIVDSISARQIKIEEKSKKKRARSIETDKKNYSLEKSTEAKKTDNKSTQESISIKKAAEKSIKQGSDIIENKKYKRKSESDPLSEAPTL